MQLPVAINLIFFFCFQSWIAQTHQNLLTLIRHHPKSQTIYQVSKTVKKITSQFEGNNIRTLLKSRGDPVCHLSMRTVNSSRDQLLEPGCSWWWGLGGHCSRRSPSGYGVCRITPFQAVRRPGTWYSGSLSHVTAMSDPALNHHD